MSIAQSMLPEFDNEMANTRKMLERVPQDKLDYKPDPKSMPLGHLAGHIAEMVGWTTSTFKEDSIDIPPDFKPFDPKSSAEVLETFEKNSKAARAALADAPDSGMMNNWSLKFGGKEMFSMPRIAVYRSMILNHVIHHRAQLGVYYRMVGVPVPGMYGPSADEK